MILTKNPTNPRPNRLPPYISHRGHSDVPGISQSTLGNAVIRQKELLLGPLARRRLAERVDGLPPSIWRAGWKTKRATVAGNGTRASAGLIGDLLFPASPIRPGGYPHFRPIDLPGVIRVQLGRVDAAGAPASPTLRAEISPLDQHSLVRSVRIGNVFDAIEPKFLVGQEIFQTDAVDSDASFQAIPELLLR